MPAPATIPSRLFQLGVFLAAGLVVSMLLAWAIALWVPINDEDPAVVKRARGPDYPPTGDWTWEPLPGMESRSLAPADATRRIERLERAGDQAWIGAFLGNTAAGNDETYALDRSPGIEFERLTLHFRMVDSEVAQVAVLSVGWPWRCAQSEHWRSLALTPGWNGRWQHAAEPPAWLLPRTRPLGNVIPLAPRWGGLALNCAFWAIPAWLTTLGYRTIRSAVRRRQGRCAACGYSLVGLTPGTPCPECGHAPHHAPPNADTTSPVAPRGSSPEPTADQQSPAAAPSPSPDPNSCPTTPAKK